MVELAWPPLPVDNGPRAHRNSYGQHYYHACLVMPVARCCATDAGGRMNAPRARGRPLHQLLTKLARKTWDGAVPKQAAGATEVVVWAKPTTGCKFRHRMPAALSISLALQMSAAYCCYGYARTDTRLACIHWAFRNKRRHVYHTIPAQPWYVAQCFGFG